MQFTEHINHICSVAKQLSSWILRTFISREQIVMITLWKSLVLPKLDYCSQLWSPNTPGMIQKIEEIQCSYVRKIKGVRSKKLLGKTSMAETLFSTKNRKMPNHLHLENNRRKSSKHKCKMSSSKYLRKIGKEMCYHIFK